MAFEGGRAAWRRARPEILLHGANVAESLESGLR
jgi:hypothetical protein